MKAFFFSTSPYRCSYYSSPVMARNKKYEKQKACYFRGNDPPRITSNVKQNLQFLRLWKFQKKNASTPKPATSYRRRKVQKEVLPADEELYEDPTTTLYYTHQGLDTAVRVLLVDGYTMCVAIGQAKELFYEREA